MKSTKFFFITCVSLGILCCTQKNIIEIPLSVQNGYGPFKAGLGGISPDSENETDPWGKTRLQVSGIPEHWTDTKKGAIDINIYQTAYQNYLQGNITQDWFDKLQKSWDWTPDTLNLSTIPLKNKVAFAFGIEASGKTQTVVDTNNNLDFSDDPIFIPVETDLMDVFFNRMDSFMQHHSIRVTYERLADNRIVRENVPLFIIHASSYNLFMYNFPQHAVAGFKGVELAVNSKNFTDLSYHKTYLVLMDDSLKNGKKADTEHVISENEYLSVKGKIYKYKGVNTNKNVMTLEKTNLPKEQLYSTQIGFRAIPFEGRNFKTKEIITLDTFKGKYVLIDFWAVWCGPCIQEFPNLTALYDHADTSKFEILGIVGDSSPEKLDESMEQFAIKWPQILSDEANTIKEKYGISSYPTTLLINSEGIIIAKNLRGHDLENKINELIAQQP
ncbi:MAG: TlpA family protein disulfide reductase [Tannerella sp.]|jgi:thiol-disulfide isomerase/thioredoxin|nr:TlpA family protein disulfide reductase [Tannerella sp.]